jgi:hypothetical protein
MDRRPWWKTRDRGGDIDPTRPARIASSRQRRVRTSGTVPLRAPRRRARLIRCRTRPYPSPNGQQSALAGATAHGAHADRRATTAMRDTPRPRPCRANARLRRDRAVASAGGLAPASFCPGGSLRRRALSPRSHGSATHQHQALSFDRRSTASIHLSIFFERSSGDRRNRFAVRHDVGEHDALGIGGGAGESDCTGSGGTDTATARCLVLSSMRGPIVEVAAANRPDAELVRLGVGGVRAQGTQQGSRAW